MKKTGIFCLWMIFIGAAFVSLGLGKAKQTQNEQSGIDVARLNITHVGASSVNGDRTLGDPFYGLQNLFDSGKDKDYSSWVTDPAAEHWITFVFDEPVEVSTVVLEASGDNRPKDFSLEVVSFSVDSEQTPEYFKSIPVSGSVTTYQFKKPVKNIGQLTIKFPGPNMIEISEIRILGKVLSDIKVVEQKPALGLLKAAESRDTITYVRIKNVSTHDYDLLLVGEEFFGMLKAGQATDYRKFDQAYSYNSVKLAIDDQVLKLTPDDYVGEKPLGRGFFSYLIGVEDLANKKLSIKAIQDK